jgi:hypothetical protein
MKMPVPVLGPLGTGCNNKPERINRLESFFVLAYIEGVIAMTDFNRRTLELPEALTGHYNTRAFLLRRTPANVSLARRRAMLAHPSNGGAR